MKNEIISFLNSEIPMLENCGRCGTCCKTFGYNGPVIQPHEKEIVALAIQKLGLANVAGYVTEKGEIPAAGPMPVERVCRLLSENNKCLLHDCAKPEVCTESPNFLLIKPEIVILQADFYTGSCRSGMDETELLQNIQKIQGMFRSKFGKSLELKINHPIENRCERYYD